LSLHWNVDECSTEFGRVRIRGWCFDDAAPIRRVEAMFPAPAGTVTLDSFGLPSPDVATVHEGATHCRFDESVALPDEVLGRDFRLRLTFAHQNAVETEPVIGKHAQGDSFFLCWDHFIDQLRTLKSGTVLEIGSRARSAISYRHYIPAHLGYIGMDILAGPNVDIVGDAHELGALFGPQRFVAAFSRSVFEHLAMPWKVALELNRVLEPAGIVYTATHQTWPLHEEPWDFWRFSQHAWSTLFNSATGFEVLEAACGEPARIHPVIPNPATRALPDHPAFLGSASIVRKVSETALTWPVTLKTAACGTYPKGELRQGPT
jgi:hypothetical protein